LPSIGEDRLKRTLYVGGLDEQVSPDLVHAAFIPFGEIRTVDMPVDKLTGKHRGFGFIEFEEDIDAQSAVDNMHDSELYGKVLTVNFARSPARQPGEGSRPVWADDFFHRRRLAQEGMEVDEASLNKVVQT